MKQISAEVIEESMLGPYTIMYCSTCDDFSDCAMEADAYNYHCESCGEDTWSSVEELMVRGEIEVI